MEARLFGDNERFFDHYVAAHPRGDLLQTTWWGKLKHTSGWDYAPIGVIDNGVLVATALLLVRTLSPLPLKLAYSPRGPLYSSPQALHALTEEVRAFCRQRHIVVWKMDPPILAGDQDWLELSRTQRLQSVTKKSGFEAVQPRFVMTLNLTHSLDRLLENMKSKTRYNIRYAERKGVQAAPIKTEGQLQTFYELLQETAQRDGFRIRPFDYFSNIWRLLVPAKVAQVFLAYKDSDALAGAICFRLGRRVWYVYGASSNEKRNLQATNLLQWEMIKWAKGLGCQIYDFRGVSGDLNPSHPLYGLYRFKQGFGATLEEYVGEYDLPIRRGGYTLWRAAYNLRERLQVLRGTLGG